MQSVKNKRRFQRFIVTRDVEVYLQTVHANVNLAGRLVDVSYPFVGLRLACSQEIPPDSRVRLEFVKEEGKQAFVYEGDIAWCVQKMSNETAQVPPHYHVGVSLKETNQKNREMLEEAIAEAAKKIVHSEASSLILVDDQTQEMTICLPTGPVEGRLAGQKVPPGQGFAGWVTVHQKPIIVQDVQADARHYTVIDSASGFETKSLIGAPLKTREGQVIGVMEAMNRHHDTMYTDEDLDIFLALADRAAIALENAHLYEDLQQAYQELKATQEQIVQQERLKALGTMASGIAHDFNNTLTGILGGLSLLLRDKTLTEKQRRYLKIAETSAEDAVQVVSRLREFYRRRDDSEAFTSIQLNELIEQSMAMTKPKWKNMQQRNGIVIQVIPELDKTLPAIAGNASELREAITNLIFNAVDAMPQGGTLTLRTRPVADENVIFEVADTGIGMTEDTRTRCLEPFFSTKGEHGTGLGLSIVYGTMKRHGGDMTIQSQLGEGTTIQIKLPVATVSEAKDVSSDVEAIRSLNILAIDDETSVRKILRELLESDGHTVEFATNGHEGLAKFISGNFDLVITDEGMPDMSGSQFARRIKDIIPNQPIILLTGWEEMTHAVDKKPKEVDYVLNKPVTLETLQQALRKVI